MIFRISKGKFCGEYISFIPPENFNLSVRQTEYEHRVIKFFSIDGSISLIICLEQTDATSIYGLNEFIKENGLYKLSEPCKVKRGNGFGEGIYYGHFSNSADGYREVHNFRKNDYMENQVSVTIEAHGWRRRDKNSIYAILGTPQIKSFFESIEFFK